MSEPISAFRMKEIDYILRHPGRFPKHDICDAAKELRAEVDRLTAVIANDAFDAVVQSWPEE